MSSSSHSTQALKALWQDLRHRAAGTILRRPCDVVSGSHAASTRFADYLSRLRTMLVAEQGLGLASPQVGLPHRLFLARLDPKQMRELTQQQCEELVTQIKDITPEARGGRRQLTYVGPETSKAAAAANNTTTITTSGRMPEDNQTLTPTLTPALTSATATTTATATTITSSSSSASPLLQPVPFIPSYFDYQLDSQLLRSEAIPDYYDLPVLSATPPASYKTGPISIIANPEVHYISPTHRLFVEGCLSVGSGIMGAVSRPAQIIVSWWERPEWNNLNLMREEEVELFEEQKQPESSEVAPAAAAAEEEEDYELNARKTISVSKLKKKQQQASNASAFRSFVGSSSSSVVRSTDKTFVKRYARIWDFSARIFLHEFDHLNGVLYVDRIKQYDHLLFQSQQEDFLNYRYQEIHSAYTEEHQLFGRRIMSEHGLHFPSSKAAKLFTPPAERKIVGAHQVLRGRKSNPYAV